MLSYGHHWKINHIHILTVVILYPQNKVSAGVTDGFHCNAGVFFNWCLGKQLPYRTGGFIVNHTSMPRGGFWRFEVRLVQTAMHLSDTGDLKYTTWQSDTWDLVLQFNICHFALGCDPHSTRPVWSVQLPVSCPVLQLVVRVKPHLRKIFVYKTPTWKLTQHLFHKEYLVISIIQNR